MIRVCQMCIRHTHEAIIEIIARNTVEAASIYVLEVLTRVRANITYLVEKITYKPTAVTLILGVLLPWSHPSRHRESKTAEVRCQLGLDSQCRQKSLVLVKHRYGIGCPLAWWCRGDDRCRTDPAFEQEADHADVTIPAHPV